MIHEAFGSDENAGFSKSLEPTMIAFVKGIMAAMQAEGPKADMEHYAQRRAAQQISQAAATLQQKGQEYALTSTAVHLPGNLNWLHACHEVCAQVMSLTRCASCRTRTRQVRYVRVFVSLRPVAAE